MAAVRRSGSRPRAGAASGNAACSRPASRRWRTACRRASRARRRAPAGARCITDRSCSAVFAVVERERRRARARQHLRLRHQVVGSPAARSDAGRRSPGATALRAPAPARVMRQHQDHHLGADASARSPAAGSWRGTTRRATASMRELILQARSLRPTRARPRSRCGRRAVTKLIAAPASSPRSLSVTVSAPCCRAAWMRGARGCARRGPTNSRWTAGERPRPRAVACAPPRRPLHGAARRAMRSSSGGHVVGPTRPITIGASAVANDARATRRSPRT